MYVTLERALWFVAMQFELSLAPHRRPSAAAAAEARSHSLEGLSQKLEDAPRETKHFWNRLDEANPMVPSNVAKVSGIDVYWAAAISMGAPMLGFK